MSTDVSQTSDPSKGWALLEAVERTVDPDKWHRWLEAEALYKKVRTPISSSPGAFLQKAPDVIREHRRGALLAFDAAKKEFWRYLEGERLIAWGSRGGPSETPTPIVGAGWRGLAVRNWHRSIVRERFGPKTKIYNVRIFPVVHSPDVAKKLIGLSFSDAFRQCVLNDPEVIVCGQRIPKEAGDAAVFREGQFPGPMVNFRWPINITSQGLAFEFVRPIVYFIDARWPDPSIEQVRAAEALCDRWTALIRVFSSATAAAVGTFARTGQVQVVDSLQWMRKHQAVDVRNGDLLELESGKWAVRWSGLRIVDRSALPHASTYPATSTIPRGRPKARVVEDALRKAGINLATDTRRPKEIAGAIAAHLPQPPRSENELAALAKMVSRLRLQSA